VVVERHSAIGSIAAEWEALADRCGAAPFLRPGWFDAWLRAFGGQPLVLATREGGELTSVLVLLRRPAALHSAANWHSPLYGAVAKGPDALQALAGALLAERTSRVDLAMVDAGDGLLVALHTAAEAAGRAAIDRQVAIQPYVTLDGDFDAYAAGLPRKQRKEIGRVRRRLEAEGELTVHFEDGSERLDELLQEGFAVEGSGWKAEQGSAIASQPETLTFYTEVARWAAERGWLRLAFLRLDGRALAFDLCIEAARSEYVLKGGFDPEYRRFGPGVVLTYESLSRAFAEGLSTYEFLGDADSYKLAWTDTTRERRRLQVFSGTPLGQAQLAAWRYGRPLVKRAAGRLGRT
jgi:CelD/BcsL family acetyltransferase involved in cellulose biosynthesis